MDEGGHGDRGGKRHEQRATTATGLLDLNPRAVGRGETSMTSRDQTLAAMAGFWVVKVLIRLNPMVPTVPPISCGRLRRFAYPAT